MIDRDTEPDPREPKLPKWAQNELQRFRANVVHYKAKLNAGPEDSNTFADPVMDKGRPIGKDTKVRFCFDDIDDNWQNYIEAKIERDHYGRCYLSVRGGDGLMFKPQVTNSVHVFIEKRR